MLRLRSTFTKWITEVDKDLEDPSRNEDIFPSVNVYLKIS